jgi:hypothetical protein
MDEPQLADVINDLHQDLARKWQAHGARIAELWRSFGTASRPCPRSREPPPLIFLAGTNLISRLRIYASKPSKPGWQKAPF